MIYASSQQKKKERETVESVFLRERTEEESGPCISAQKNNT